MASGRSQKEYLRSIEEYANPLWVAEGNCFCDTFLDLRDGAIIDVGCGVGQVLEELNRENRISVGMDINQYLVRYAKGHHFQRRPSSVCFHVWKHCR